MNGSQYHFNGTYKSGFKNAESNYYINTERKERDIYMITIKKNVIHIIKYRFNGMTSQ